MNTKCRYCAESLPFYKRVAESQRGDRRTRVVAIFPNAHNDVKQYVQNSNLNLETHSEVDFGALGIAGTPTAILLDNAGKIRNFWVGKLPQDVEEQIIQSLSTPTLHLIKFNTITSPLKPAPTLIQFEDT